MGLSHARNVLLKHFKTAAEVKPFSNLSKVMTEAIY